MKQTLKVLPFGLRTLQTQCGLLRDGLKLAANLGIIIIIILLLLLLLLSFQSFFFFLREKIEISSNLLKYSNTSFLTMKLLSMWICQTLSIGVGVAKSGTTCELDTTNPFINRSWVEAKWVRVIFRLTQLTCFINRSGSCSTCEPV